MTSSDSDDDCYSNIARKLEQMKNKFREKQVENDSLVENAQKYTSDTKNVNDTSFEDLIAPSCSNNSSAPVVTPEKTVKSKSKRVTRSSAKNVEPDDNQASVLPPKRTRARKTRASAAPPSPLRPRRQSRETNSRSTANINNRSRRNTPSIAQVLASVYHDSVPTYSIDADNVPDQSENIALFSKPKSNDDVVVIEENENDSFDDNEELSVKVYWQSCEIVKFLIRKYQKITQIFDYFSQKHNVSHDKLLLTYKERILSPNDTPDVVGYEIVKFIEGGIVNQSVSQLVTNDNEKIKDGIKIKFQCQNLKKPFEITVRLNDKFSLAMTKCAEHLEIPLNKLRFEFDGDSISGKNTAQEMKLEGGECIDVKILS